MDEKDMTISDVAGLKAAYPQLCDQIIAQAVDAERERLRAIDEIAAGIPEGTLMKAKYEEPVSAADLALAQMRANATAGQQFLAERGVRRDGQGPCKRDEKRHEEGIGHGYVRADQGVYTR